jgi:hypothetical protein
MRAVLPLAARITLVNGSVVFDPLGGSIVRSASNPLLAPARSPRMID